MSAKKAVVLSGGGAKGGYQIGAWQALRELGFKPDIVTGTSVGSFNGALMASDKFEEAMDLWSNINMGKVFAQFADENAEEDEEQEDYIRSLAKKALFKGGADFSPLRNVLETIVNEEQIRNSHIDFGLVTTKFPYKKRFELFIDQIPQGEVIDYIIASASIFPLIRSYKIGQTKFIDGGYSDNMPVQMAIDRGATEIVAINIGNLAVQKLKENNAMIYYVRSKKPLNEGRFGGVALFDKEMSLNNIKQGYIDTYKTFRHYEGCLYTFDKGETKYFELMEDFIFHKLSQIFCILPTDNRFERMGLKNITEFWQEWGTDPFIPCTRALACGEAAADILDLNPRNVYLYNDFCFNLLEDSIQLITADTSERIAQLTKQLDKGISFDLLRTLVKNWDKKLILGFTMQLLMEERLEQAQKRRLWLVASLMPDVFCAALFCAGLAMN